jgi:hypothetical protein
MFVLSKDRGVTAEADLEYLFRFNTWLSATSLESQHPLPAASELNRRIPVSPILCYNLQSRQLPILTSRSL